MKAERWVWFPSGSHHRNLALLGAAGTLLHVCRRPRGRGCSLQGASR